MIGVNTIVALPLNANKVIKPNKRVKGVKPDKPRQDRA
jgi:hypothetical protein